VPALGQKLPRHSHTAMSAVIPKADTDNFGENVR